MGKKKKKFVLSSNLDDSLDPENKCNNLSITLIFQRRVGRTSNFIIGYDCEFNHKEIAISFSCRS